MAADDRYIISPATVTNTNYMTIQPSAGVECIVKNIISSGAAEVYLYDGTYSVLIDSSAGAVSWLNWSIDITNAVYIRVKNVSGTDQIMAATGVQTK